MFTRRRIWVGGLLLLVATLTGGLSYRHHKRYKHLAIHDPGMVYRCAWLEPDVFAELIETYQSRTVLNLCEPNELGEKKCVDQRSAVRGSGARLIELPMPAAAIDPADPAIQPFSVEPSQRSAELPLARPLPARRDANGQSADDVRHFVSWDDGRIVALGDAPLRPRRLFGVGPRLRPELRRPAWQALPADGW